MSIVPAVAGLTKPLSSDVEAQTPTQFMPLKLHMGDASLNRALYQIRAARSRNAFSTTEIDEALIAKAAKIGLMRMPVKG